MKAKAWVVGLVSAGVLAGGVIGGAAPASAAGVECTAFLIAQNLHVGPYLSELSPPLQRDCANPTNDVGIPGTGIVILATTPSNVVVQVGSTGIYSIPPSAVQTIFNASPGVRYFLVLQFGTRIRAKVSNVTLGTVKANAKGRVKTPGMKFSKPGTYAVELRDASGTLVSRATYVVKRRG